MTKRIIIVDEYDTPIRLLGYGERQYKDIYRASALWLTDNATGAVLLQQRKKTKHNNPGKWQCAAAGTVEEGETYEQNMVKEIAEEIGLHDLALREGPKVFVDEGQHRFFCQWFFAAVDKPTANITIQESEVESVRWIDEQTLIHEVTTSPEHYTPSAAESLRILGILDYETDQQRTIIAIAKEDDWQKAKDSGYYTKSTITSELRDVGFLHCSFPNQTIDIANRHFSEYKKLLLLFIDPTKVRANIVYEQALSGRPGSFPHIYGPLNIDAVYDTAVLAQTSTGMFTAPEKLARLGAD